VAEYRTVIKKANGQPVAPTPAQGALRDARITQGQRARKSPHLKIVVQTRIGGIWEDYD
jgi:hypothetical protein